MNKLPILLNICSGLLGLTAIILIMILLSHNDEARKSISSLQVEIDQVLAQMKEDAPVLAARRSREKARNLEIEQVVQGHRDAFNTMTQELKEAKENLEQYELSKKSEENKLEALRESSKEKASKLEVVQATGMELNLKIPQLEQEISELIDREQDLLAQTEAVSTKISGYDEVTNVWREHYRSTQRSTRSYVLQRPWIEPGEKISLSFSSLDLSSGTMALPVGTNEGMRKGMNFSLLDPRGKSARFESLKSI